MQWSYRRRSPRLLVVVPVLVLERELLRLDNSCNTKLDNNGELFG